MPLLLGLRVPDYLLTVCWLFSPVLGLFLHPFVGKMSDVHGRRPWTVLFGTLAAVGLVVTALCPLLLSGTPGAAAATAIVAFGITDMSHDTLVTPTRAAMNDLFDADASERRSALAAGVGKLLGQLCATFLHSSAAFMTTAGLIAAATAAQLLAPSERPCRGGGGSCAAGEEAAAPTASRAPPGFALIWLLSFAGWVSTCTFSFYFTSVWSEQAGFSPGTPEFTKEVKFACVLLMGNAVVFFAAGAALPAISRAFGGELRATAVAVVVLALVLLSFGNTPRPCAAAATLVAMPFGYQVVTNAPFAWLERQPGFAEAERGRLTGWLNASLAAAQTITAVASGPLVAAAGGRLVVAFHAVAVLDVIVVAAVAGLALRGRRRAPSEPLATAAL